MFSVTELCDFGKRRRTAAERISHTREMSHNIQLHPESYEPSEPTIIVKSVGKVKTLF